jgi:hypothetical protein
MRMRFEVRRIDPCIDGRLLVQLAGDCGNYFQLFMPGSDDVRLRIGQEFILSNVDEGPAPLFGSTKLPLGGRQIRLEDEEIQPEGDRSASGA